MSNLRFFVEKKEGFNLEAKKLLEEFKLELGIKKLENVRLLNIYDIFNLEVNKEDLEAIKYSILSEITTDDIYENIEMDTKNYFAVEYLDGQFDMRANSTIECINILIDTNKNFNVKSAHLIMLYGDISYADLEKIKSNYINKIEARQKDLSVLKLNEVVFNSKVDTFDNFITLSDLEIDKMRNDLSLSMSNLDLRYIRDYFIKEKRNPTETEIRVFDTYWSDHCRHTTFETKIEKITFPDSEYGEMLNKEFEKYILLKNDISKNKNICLMDMATIIAKYLRKTGKLDDLEVSSENNACSIYIDVDTIDNKGNKAIEKYLLMFKNETHNHPTEIEPYGGASTCLGGAIRDPLSGRAYVYQAIRVSGAANPLEKIEDTLKSKLSQRKISKGAAKGYSSYGNQIGIATSLVNEIYHEGYRAKRMEVGAVVAAAKLENVIRQEPIAGDNIILLGGKTGRDGIGGATGSSKEHNNDSLELSGAEVQKGNAPEERKLQRLFRNENATKLIKKCNDFGAGGVCVAIGELADSIYVNLDLVPTKYDGLNGTELAISESQERMAVVITKENTEKFLELAKEENLLATVVGSVRDDNRLVLSWKGTEIVNIDRSFLNTNGITQKTNVQIQDKKEYDPFENKVEGSSLKEKIINNMTKLNTASQKGLAEMFDSTVGASTVLMPYGGKYQLTPIQTSISKIPMLDKDTNTVSAITYGFNPSLFEYSEYYGAIYSVIESLAKLVASGVDYKKARLSFQEYFPKLANDPVKWSKPFISLLGSMRAQLDFNTAAIGGKDSMSGTFNDLEVPSTLISFAVASDNIENIISPEFKKSNSYIYLVDNNISKNNLYDKDAITKNFDYVLENIKNKNILSAYVVTSGGIIEAILKMSFGNKIGFNITNENINIFNLRPSSLVIESSVKLDNSKLVLLGKTTDKFVANINNYNIDLEDVLNHWLNKFSKVFEYKYEDKKVIYENLVGKEKEIDMHSKLNLVNPRVLILAFPGTNSEYDMYNAFNKNGAKSKILLFRNLDRTYIEDSIDKIVKELENAEIFVLPGGFSLADEPDGSGKFIATILNNAKIKDAINRFIARDGLILGICNGFQALVKSGLLPYGEVRKLDRDSPTLSFNKISRHISQMVNTRIVTNNSPWLSSYNIGDVHNIAVSHGEGRFYANEKVLEKLIKNNQIATQYVDLDKNATNESPFNPNGSSLAIEGIISEDGHILGKMGHSERYSKNIYKNILEDKDQNIFKNGVEYFK
ncbi:phosphoribosylformylglycinamidine synthase [Oceanivirga miroungae]|uniref:Phosphoribosylformylglycinamidine synthase n=1 Tax=Oceanivirga miroungae TaxID=1130046 RepID=A0A6I8MEK2_9FUSO|nr:phosphoribosylformylglycinamidine synthase [Oceanivirga miroungae]VWL85524.1 phosphoribosylformylglycinamidine synthase [Oceanivirga miroungae]